MPKWVPCIRYVLGVPKVNGPSQPEIISHVYNGDDDDDFY